ncbi:hypothetical protein ASZ78_010902 [Callipepla squamata]|uniref:Ligand-dependent corepressor n=1 Tax=Callipepla squamata TaxID=9009 RepID=A0A226NIG9_CALSU|nr:hypothetical protein ASZ78_010902 [Callipepla squamata]
MRPKRSGGGRENGSEDAAEAVAIDSNNQPKSPLEKFMVRLCTHHQKQFIRVLNDIYTEVQPDCEGQQSSESESMEASTCGSGCSQQSTENQDKAAACTDPRPLSSLELGQPGTDSVGQPAELKPTDRAESPSPALRRDFPDPPSTRLRSASPMDSSTQGYLSTLNSSSLNFHHAAKSLEGQAAGHEQDAGIRSPPRRADKENALQCGSKASLHQDLDAKEQDMRPKPDNHLHAAAKGKAGCHLHPADKGPLDKSKEGWLPAGTAPTSHRAPAGHPRAKAASLRPSRKSKKASGLRINDYDNQCDVVYISQPITECHFESQRAVSSRRTARKSTRGYFFNGECCELPTVRTLVKSSRVEERGGSTAQRTQALVSTKPTLVLSGGSSSGAGRDGEKRVSLRLLAKGAPADREMKGREVGVAPSGDGSSKDSDAVPAAGCAALPATEAAVREEGSPDGMEVNKSTDTIPDAELSVVPGDTSLEQEEAAPAITALPVDSEGEAEQNNSPAGEKEPAEEETLPEPDGLETADKDSISSKESLDKKRKKGRRTLVASDRRLRSQQSQPPAEGSTEDAGSSSPVHLPGLQIKASKSPVAKRFKREGNLDGTTPAHFPNDCFHSVLLQHSGGPSTGQTLENSAEENGVTTRQTYKSILAKETASEGENSCEDDPSATGDQSQPGEMLDICVQTDAEKSVLPLAESSMPAGNVEAEVKLDDVGAKEESSDSAIDTGKLEHYEPVGSRSPCPTSKGGGSKHLPVKAAKHKKVTPQFYNLRHTPAPADTAQKSLLGKESMQAVPRDRDECSSGNDDALTLEDMDVEDSKPRFMEWCAEEENQELIAEFNAQYMKVQKGWIQLEKEVQPAPKVKNKADKLKEIWKSKKRTRKSRGALEVQKLSPVQMLFMKAYKLSDICQWFLETTETRSLVIVKKLNTRLPGEIPPIKVPMQKYSSSGLYPSSLQAERLKKHLKKFAATTPARNNLKNQKLWAKIRENADKAEAEEGNAAGQPPPPETGPEEPSQERGAMPTPSLPTQASTRILRKYSQLRGKLRAQHRAARADRRGDIKADAFPAKSPAADGAGKGRKGKSKGQEEPSPRAEQLSRKKRTLKESEATQERAGSSGKDKVERSSKLAKKLSLKEKRAPKRQLEKKMANKKAGGGKALPRAVRKGQEGSSSQGKRKLRAKGDCSHSKRSRLDAK